MVRRAIAIRPESMALIRARCENLTPEIREALRRGSLMQRIIAAMADAHLNHVLRTPTGVRLPERPSERPPARGNHQ